ncbi:hypothetical protein [Nocardiopsis potens]|uniref:hypothetical protein n=1 Tax=Nocardiopsis potens TaxID=1246458 RepID=UPI00037511B7|nr:hypothetical protein [Nocardiopsis potens]
MISSAAARARAMPASPPMRGAGPAVSSAAARAERVSAAAISSRQARLIPPAARVRVVSMTALQ